MASTGLARFLVSMLTLTTGILGGSASYGQIDNYWQAHGPAKISPHREHYANLNPNVSFHTTTIVGDVHVIVTSQQPTKIAAAREIFSHNPRFKNSKIILKALSASSKIAEQPLGIDNAEKGAANRIKYIKDQYPDLTQQTDYFVSIESFFTKPDTYQPREHAFILIEDQKQQYRYVSDGVTIHPEIYDLALDKGGLTSDGTGANVTVGEIMANIYSVDPNNWHEFVTQHKFNRVKQILSAFEGEVFF